MKYNEGQWVSKDDHVEPIICRSDLKRRWRPLGLGGLLITLGLGYIIRTVWVDGCNAFEAAEYEALHKAGIFTDINKIDTDTYLTTKDEYRRNY